jgi:hypothetical protein
MTQEPLRFGRLYEVADGVRSTYRALNDAVDQLGIVVAAGACGADRADVRRALDRDGRAVKVEWAIAIAAAAGPDARRAIAEALVSALGFRISDAAPPLSDKERADKLEAVVAALGPIAQEAARAALGGRR